MLVLGPPVSACGPIGFVVWPTLLSALDGGCLHVELVAEAVCEMNRSD